MVGAEVCEPSVEEGEISGSTSLETYLMNKFQ